MNENFTLRDIHFAMPRAPHNSAAVNKRNDFATAVDRGNHDGPMPDLPATLMTHKGTHSRSHCMREFF